MKNMVSFIIHEDMSIFKDRLKYVFKNQNGGINAVSLSFLLVLNMNNMNNLVFDGYSDLVQITSVILNAIIIGVMMIFRVMYPLNISKLMYMLPKKDSNCREYLELKYMVHFIYPSIVWIVLSASMFIGMKSSPIYLIMICLSIVLFNGTSSFNIFDGGTLLNYENIKKMTKNYPKLKRYSLCMEFGQFAGLFNIGILSNTVIIEANRFITILCLIILLVQIFCFYKVYFKMRYELFDLASNYELTHNKKVSRR